MIRSFIFVMVIFLGAPCMGSNIFQAAEESIYEDESGNIYKVRAQYEVVKKVVPPPTYYNTYQKPKPKPKPSPQPQVHYNPVPPSCCERCQDSCSPSSIDCCSPGCLTLWCVFGTILAATVGTPLVLLCCCTTVTGEWGRG